METNLSFKSKGGIIRTFLPLTNALRIVHKILLRWKSCLICWKSFSNTFPLRILRHFSGYYHRPLTVAVMLQFPIANILFINFIYVIHYLSVLFNINHWGSLSLQVIVLLGIKVWSIVLLKRQTWSLTFLPSNNSSKSKTSISFFWIIYFDEFSLACWILLK